MNSPDVCRCPSSLALVEENPEATAGGVGVVNKVALVNNHDGNDDDTDAVVVGRPGWSDSIYEVAMPTESPTLGQSHS